MEETVALAGPRLVKPVAEEDTLLERRRRFADELALVDVEEAQGLADGRERAFADADDADVRRFQQA